jgi:hypothetical protein
MRHELLTSPPSCTPGTRVWGHRSNQVWVLLISATGSVTYWMKPGLPEVASLYICRYLKVLHFNVQQAV